MSASPNKGFVYMVDGSEDNIDNLSKTLRSLDASLQLVLESFSVTETPTSPEPGQAWFVPNDTAMTGDWATLFGDQTGQSTKDSIFLYGFVDYQSYQLGWTLLPVREAAWGYVADRGDRFQWSGSEWIRQTKTERTTVSKFYTTTVPLPYPGGNTTEDAITLFRAPFTLEIISIRLLALEDPLNLSFPERPLILPRIAWSNDRSLNFSSWTTIVTQGPDDASGGWDPTTMSAAQTAAYADGVLSTEASGVQVPANSRISFGKWEALDPGVGDVADNYSATLNCQDLSGLTFIIEYTESI